MPSVTVTRYFDSLKREDLHDVNEELRRLHAKEQQISLFHNEGVLVLEDVFDDMSTANAVSACESLETLVENDQASYADINLEAQGGGWKGQYGSTKSHTGKIRKVKNLLDHGQEFKLLALHPSLILIISKILGPEFSLHSKGFLMNKPPEVSTEKPWHQDSAYFDTDSQVITVWIPLQDVDEVNGCLYAIPGSHNWGTLKHIGAEAHLDPLTLPLDLVRPYPVQKGGICIMDKSTVHYSGLNRSTAARRALIFRYEKNRNTIELNLNGHRIAPNGLLSEKMLRGEMESTIEKRHLIIARVLRERALKEGRGLIDMGTDYSYPFYKEYTPTQAALQALRENAAKALHYPSSFGMESLRKAFRDFMQRRFGVNVDWKREIMINTGASQAFDALSRALNGRHVLLPQMSLPTVGVIAAGNGAELLRLPSDDRTGMIQLTLAQAVLDGLAPGDVRFLYLNSPVNPTGQVASLAHLEQIVRFAQRNNIIVVHDMDSWYTQHTASGRLHNILEVQGAIDCCVTVLSVSKEFGLPGIRVGLIAGNPKVVNAIRIHNSTFAVMIPEICQVAAQAAIESFDQGDGKDEINLHVTGVLQKTTEGWTSLGWPDEAVYPPSGGFKYLVAIPPGIQPQGSFSAVELLDFYIASRANVKLSTSRSFDPTNDRFLRLVLMQNMIEVDEVFERLGRAGVHYGMMLPSGLAQEYEAFLRQFAGSDF